MIKQIDTLLSEARLAIQEAKTSNVIESIRLEYLGRQGKLTTLLRGVKELPVRERPQVGGAANSARQEIEQLLSDAVDRIEGGEIAIDTTLPGISPETGHLHLVTKAIEEIAAIFKQIGFTRVRHPDIETEWFPFEALNMPADHPARDEWETFFMDAKPSGDYRFMLTPHGTSGTARSLATLPLPVRSINIQKCYRRQSDASHTPVFHQFDGVYAAEGVTFQHLKGVLEFFVKAYFGTEREVRLRPYHFRFTEPSFEVDISCGVCNGKGCRLCKQGWVELGGAGMLHPNVLKAAKLNPKKISGLAFGWGVERTMLMRSGLSIPDIRILYENDMRFLQQF
ncbi:phenylalanine--tRNA ligase subunit alpha [Candidatus Uhrbacteria bacterium CG10_big_fil_rev_8_21_14_0_10_48_11]|uniref:phenylalanine--tRNA ligase n=1 Tax=Candidatus Uhrbacteria bacterium CG10_big_fil_rev_8_21_14_0_10_48_11 TaxID=1975037 RepID=A0A2M8LDZ8_9BACT|nr:MAG: phenylalanine--tRNA ligase subunit alpha [Candidatus Uhrbacteria bacterium CG10_big_fil_rev_8_21_14_0_10_48_11]